MWGERVEHTVPMSYRTLRQRVLCLWLGSLS